jgi:peptidoglycan/LPS O-acetylase OafA/YrhL
MSYAERSAIHATSSKAPRLGFLDGIRGLAAFVVLVSHMYYQAGKSAGFGHYRLPAAYAHLAGVEFWGRDAVSVFIVLSGFSLMLPLARSGDDHLRGGVGKYFARRARRILPGYYAACVLAAGFDLAAHSFKAKLGMIDTDTANAWTGNLTAGALLSHLFLVQNFHPKWVYAIEPALWSVAVEWQIYFFLPLVLLPILRRFGLAATVLAAFALGFLPHLTLGPERNFDWSAPWFLGLFALGMAGAVFAVSPSRRDFRNAVPWGGAALAAFALTYGFLGALLHQRANQFVMDAGIGVTATLFIVHCCEASRRSTQSAWLGRVLSAKPAAVLGSFSYSLYLTHNIVITRVATLFASHRVPAAAFLPAIWFVGIALSLAFAYAFHRCFERPFLTTSQRENYVPWVRSPRQLA